MTKQTIGIGSTANDGTGDPLRTAFDKANDNFDELYNSVPVALESFSGASTTAKLESALTSGERVAANAASYDIDPADLSAITVPAWIEFGRNTVINSLQTSGTKLPILRFAGAGLTGSAITVTHIEGETGTSTTYLRDTITVADASGFSVGDVVLLSENEDTQLETQFTGTAIQQDFNYREYLTISAISSNDITFEEFLRFPHDTNNTLRLQKVSFLDGVHVSGGVFSGPTAAGGGAELSYCRNSSVSHLRCIGTGEATKNGGSALQIDNCWQCSFDDIFSKHTLFLLTSVKNQSCQYTRLAGKRTSSGGVIISGDTFCAFESIIEDSVGDDNGDAIGMNNAARNNIISNAIVHGARCYTLWMHQSCDNNTFQNVQSRAGVTAGFNVFGDDNTFENCLVKGHGGAGISDGGQRNRYNVDIDVSGHGVLLSGAVGTIVRGKVKTASTVNRDIQLSTTTGVDVQVVAGTRGVNLSGVNTGPIMRVSGPNPYYTDRLNRPRGWSWDSVITVADTGADVQIPLADDSLELVDWEAISTTTNDAVCYRVTMKNMATFTADTYSEYLVIDSNGALSIQTIHEGAHGQAPRLILTSGVIQSIRTTAGSNLTAIMIEKF
jgi:hypothetical protein